MLGTRRLDGGDAEDVRAMVWMGGAGAASHTHYDKMSNMHVVLHGTKTFELAPPAEWAALYPYSLLHPGAQKSQVFEPLAGVAQRFPRWSRAAFTQTATLGPGDVLYLPQFHFHRVTSAPAFAAGSGGGASRESESAAAAAAAAEPAITFSVWSSAAESRWLESASRAALPDILGTSSVSPGAARAALRQFTLLLLSHDRLRGHVASLRVTGESCSAEAEHQKPAAAAILDAAAAAVQGAARFVRETIYEASVLVVCIGGVR